MWKIRTRYRTYLYGTTRPWCMGQAREWWSKIRPTQYLRIDRILVSDKVANHHRWKRVGVYQLTPVDRATLPHAQSTITLYTELTHRFQTPKVTCKLDSSDINWQLTSNDLCQQEVPVSAAVDVVALRAPVVGPLPSLCRRRRHSARPVVAATSSPRGRGGGRRAVSYTHLTLPTIYSV